MAPRPIEPHELPYLQAVAARIREWRLTAGLSQQRLSNGAGLTTKTVWSVEHAKQRMRPSTARRLLEIVVRHAPELGDVDVLHAELVALAGPAIGKEFANVGRVDRRRNRNARKYKRNLAAGSIEQWAWMDRDRAKVCPLCGSDLDGAE